ncbi:hypothetical protein FAB82_01440 [Glycomyces buryatensis]|uniref:Uncharacterized protein n=2 Tax=Glycomyces buryatensis TaxID=2570927 RepID=A0A4S8QGD8_9ACTN|nr:hypothetical protein FAB82_01440 [Glycomyces buryatensis]
MASKSTSPPAALAVSLAGGLALGVLTNLAQGWLPGAWNQIANSGAVWAAVAFAAGAALAGRCRLPTLAAAGLCVEIGLVAGYYGYATLARHDDVGSLLGWPVLWAAFACVAGPLLAVAAAWWRRGRTGWHRAAGLGALGGLFGAEGLHYAVVLHYPAQVWACAAVALAVPLLAVRGERTRTLAAVGALTLVAYAAVFLPLGLL